MDQGNSTNDASPNGHPGSEMVERVARTIWASKLFQPARGDWDACEWGVTKTFCFDAARSVIAAIREPTRAMRRAANDVEIERVGDRPDETVVYFPTGYEAQDIWHAMIDAALSDAN